MNTINHTNNNLVNGILFMTFDQPGNGGAATNLYRIYKHFINNNNSIKMECFMVFIVNKLVFPVENYIKNDPNIWILTTKELDIKYNDILNRLKKCDNITIMYKIYKTHNIINKYFNQDFMKHKIYLVSGLKILNSFFSSEKNNNKIKDVLLNLSNVKKYVTDAQIMDELNPIINSDKVIFNSMLTANIFKDLINHHTQNYQSVLLNKINTINTSAIFSTQKNVKPFDSRTYDVLYATSNFDRHIKNPHLALNIFADDKLKKYKKIIIGNNPPNYIARIKNMAYYKNLPKDKFHDILSNTKLVFITSFYDSSPNLLYEAIEFGCNVLISNNVGIQNDLQDKLEFSRFSFNDDQDNIIDKIIKGTNDNNFNKNIIEEYRKNEIDKLVKLVVQ